MAMRLYRSQIPRLAEDIIDTLVKQGDIVVDVSDRADSAQDLVAIMEAYLRRENQVVQRTRELMEQGQITYDQFGKVKAGVAESETHPTGDDGIRWMAQQFLENFMISRYVDEVFGTDREMKRTIMRLFRKHLIEEADLDREVRQRLKNVRPGTPAWDIEYRRVLDEVRRKRGLSA